MPCCSPTKSPRRCEASGKAKPFIGLFEPDDGFAAARHCPPIGGGYPTPFYMLSHIPISSEVNLNRHTVLLSHKKSEKMRSIGKGEAFQRAFHRLFICYRIYQSHLQSISIVIPCYSPTTPQAGSLRTALPPQGTVPNRSRTLAGRQGERGDWDIVNAEILFQAFTI